MTEVRLLERESELALLEGVVRTARAGTGQMVMITGAAGIGKSRLLEQAHVMAGEQGLRVVRGRGAELEREFAFGVVRQLFERLLTRASAQERQAWLSGAANATGPLWGSVVGGAMPGEFALLHGLYWLMLNVCQDSGAMLIVDDLHWADEPSLRFLAYLLPRLEGVPLVVVTAARPQESGTARYLLDLFAADSACSPVPVSPLSVRASTLLVEQSSGRGAEPEFVRACHQATGGNPLLLTELMRALQVAGVEPAARNVAEVERLGPQAISRRVAVELHRLSTRGQRMAEALAVMAPHAATDRVAQLVGVDPAEAAPLVDELLATQLIEPTSAEHGGWHEFVHPLVRAAVYDQIGRERLTGYHARAAQLLIETGARTEEIAAHLLRLSPAADPARVAVLREAARDAGARGSPGVAFTYLRRALAEPPTDDLRAALLTEAGLAARNVHTESGAEYLAQALTLIPEPRLAGRLATWLGTALLHAGNPDQAVKVWTRAIDDLPPADDDLRRELQAHLISVPSLVPGWTDILQRLPELRSLPPADSIGALLLDCMIGVLDAVQSDPRGQERARLAVADPRLIDLAGHGAPLASAAYFTVTISDLNAGISAQTDVITRARTQGSMNAQIQHLYQRGRALLGRGDLEDAEADLREGLRLAEMIHFSLASPVLRALLAETQLEQGDIQPAVRTLEGSTAPDQESLPDLDPNSLHTRARVLHAQGRDEEALNAAMSAGRQLAAIGANNPAMAAWRSQAALSLHALGDDSQARQYAEEELELATRWGAPHTLGHALRITGLLTPGPDGIELLRQAVKVLETSPAKLAHARALIDLGAALRRTGARSAARPHLAAGLDLAYRCGMSSLIARARTELLATGARPRRPAVFGPDALTPSERRIADLAAQGLSNREIALQLYVTIKTIEVHLGSVYRKLGISRRDQVAARLISKS